MQLCYVWVVTQIFNNTHC